MKKLKLLDTFSGIGGFSYAAEKLVGGFETTQFIEIDPYCQKVLKKHWSNVPIHDDITTFTAKPFQYDAICSGFPCQDISTAGRGKGITKETRSGLFYELIRIVRMVRPKYIILENVAAILNNGLGIVLGELSEAGYDAEWSVISASSLGACHQRSRWFCVAINREFAYPNDNGSPSAEKSRSIEKADGGTEKRKNQACQSQRGSESRDAETIQLDAYRPQQFATTRCITTRSAEERQGYTGERLWQHFSHGYSQTTANTFSTRTQIQYEQRGSSIWNLPSSYGKKGSTLMPQLFKPMSLNNCLRRGDDGLSNWTHRLKALGNSS